MARPYKQTVDYFPHDTDASERKTLTVIQNKYGNDGYAFWFKLLELLGKQPGHYYDYNNPSDWEFLLAKTGLKDTETGKGILETLAMLGAIDIELYAYGIIWSQNFVNRVIDAYDRTIAGPPKRPDLPVNVPNSGVNVSISGVSVNNHPNSVNLEGVLGVLPVVDAHITTADMLPKKPILPVNVPFTGVSVDNNPVNVNTNAQTKLKETKLKIKETTKEKAATAEKGTGDKPCRAATEADFLEFVQETKARFPDLNCEVEFEKFRLWWSEGPRKLKRPKTAWLNWMGKAREFKQNGGNGRGKIEQRHGAIPKPHEYTRPPVYDD